ncbi:MAG TPA: DUF3014 domain-containing protein, partial [Burkholderiaceae bacterium]|nr:DUF3014 domain-containing protein [Burkholderiaceae bacterium]
MNRPVLYVLAGALIAVGAFVYYINRPTEPQASQVVETPAPPPAPAPAPAAPTIRHPVETPPPAEPGTPALAPLDRSDEHVRSLLLGWFGKDTVMRFLQLDNFIRHAVATVDNLGRAHAAPRLWPVNPTPARFDVVQRGDITVVSPDNASRYAPLIAFIESIDTERAVALYRRWYPWFQQAYEELGYPGRYFNDRLVDVIDLLLAAPVPAEPLEVRLTEVKGPVPSTQPWTRYEFADPALESLTAGQKMMIRVGPTQQRRLQLKLTELRGRVA